MRNQIQKIVMRNQIRKIVVQAVVGTKDLTTAIDELLSLCENKTIEEEQVESLSVCCGAVIYTDIDICSLCKEHV